MRLPLIKPIKKQQLTITPFLYLNQGLIENTKNRGSSRLSAGILGSRFALATAKRLDLDAQRPTKIEGGGCDRASGVYTGNFGDAKEGTRCVLEYRRHAADTPKHLGQALPRHPNAVTPERSEGAIRMF